jgi:Sap, sulfolipid-1-addressing protein
VVLNLVLIGLGISLEPFPLTAFILLLSSEKGTRKGLVFVLGWLACLVLVVACVVLTTQGKPPAPSTAQAADLDGRDWTGCRCGPSPG